MPLTINSGDGFQGTGLCPVRVNQIRAEITSASPARVTTAPAVIRGQNASGTAKGHTHRSTATPAPTRARNTRGGGKCTLAPPYLLCVALIRIGTSAAFASYNKDTASFTPGRRTSGSQ